MTSTAKTAAAGKAEPNKHGVTWATSKSGGLSIAVGADEEFMGQMEVQVWARPGERSRAKFPGENARV